MNTTLELNDLESIEVFDTVRSHSSGFEAIVINVLLSGARPLYELTRTDNGNTALLFANEVALVHKHNPAPFRVSADTAARARSYQEAVNAARSSS